MPAEVISDSFSNCYYIFIIVYLEDSFDLDSRYLQALQITCVKCVWYLEITCGTLTRRLL